MSEPQTPPPAPGPPAPPVPPVPSGPPAVVQNAQPVPPVPQYGEYAPGGYVPTQPRQPEPYGAASFPQQPVKRRKTWDLVLTIVLLTLGFFGMLLGLLYSAMFNDPIFMDGMAAGTGLDGFNGEVGAAPAIVSISHVLLFLAAIGGSLPLLITKRVAFWVPLTAGVIAAIIFWVTFTAVFLSDPGFVATYS